MLIKKFSASSLDTLDGCEAKFFLSYILGYREPSGDAATKGNVIHDVLEAVALSKMIRQGNAPRTKVTSIGEIGESYCLRKMTSDCFDHYMDKYPHLKWKDSDKDLCIEYAERARSGPNFPEKLHEIVEPERWFDVPIMEDWAEYDYKSITTGEIKQERLRVVGKIDLIFRKEDGSIWYMDYKTGLKGPFNWNKGKVKTKQDMMEDIQLCLYYWAIKKMYPEESLGTVIWYTNTHTDDPWEFNFTSTQSELALAYIRIAFDKIKSKIDGKLDFAHGGQTNVMKLRSKPCWICKFRKLGPSLGNREDLEQKYNNKANFKPTEDGNLTLCDCLAKFQRYRDLVSIRDNCIAKREKK